MDVGDAPRGVATAGEVAYVAVAGADLVKAIDLATGRIVDQIDVAGAPWGVVAIDGDLWISTAAGSEVMVLDTSSLSVSRTLPVGGPSRDLVGDEDGTIGYLSVEGRLIDVDRGARATIAEVDGSLPLLDQDGGRVAVAGDDLTSISVFDQRDGSEVDHVALSFSAVAFILQDDLLLVSGGGAELAVYRLAGA